MLSVLEEPAVRERVAPISVESYHVLGETGRIAERTELIRGAIIEKMSQSPLHASVVELLRDALLSCLPEGFVLRQEKPLTLRASEPEPDLAIVRGNRQDFLASHPHSAALIVEVAVSSDVLERIKLGLYAEADVPECWLVLAEARMVERHTEPGGGCYQRVERVAYPQQIASTVFPSVVLPPPGLFGA